LPLLSLIIDYYFLSLILIIDIITPLIITLLIFISHYYCHWLHYAVDISFSLRLILLFHYCQPLRFATYCHLLLADSLIAIISFSLFSHWLLSYSSLLLIISHWLHYFAFHYFH
jgi:hypothetical protein